MDRRIDRCAAHTGYRRGMAVWRPAKLSLSRAVGSTILRAARHRTADSAMNTNVDPRARRGQIQRAEAGPARLARHDGGGRRGDAHQRRRARARDRRHRRHLPAQDRQPAGAVRRHPGLSEGPPHPGQPAHLDPPHQHDDGQSGRRHRDRAGAALAQIHEGGQDHPAGRGGDRARCWRTSRPATTSTCSRFRCRAGTSTTAATTSAPATW